MKDIFFNVFLQKSKIFYYIFNLIVISGAFIYLFYTFFLYFICKYIIMIVINIVVKIKIFLYIKIEYSI